VAGPNFTALVRRLSGFVLLAKKSKEDLTILRDRLYSLSEVPEAIRYLEDAHARGKVVITVNR